MMERRWLLLGAVLALGGLAGCGETVEDVDRADYAVNRTHLKKSALEGTWYYRQTVVDVPPTVGLLFDGIELKLDKIYFEVREDKLIARRAYETIPGLEQEQALAGADFQGDPVIEWKIVSHYDLIRDFDRTTGEQRNVLVENTDLRPWWERDYIRVDWQSPVADGNVDILGDLAFFSAITGNTRGTGYRVADRDPEDPDHLQVDDGLIITTDRVFLSYWITCAIEQGFLPWVTTNTRNPCGTGEVKVRQALVRVDPEDDVQFEAVPYLDRDVLRDDEGEIQYYATVSVRDAAGELKMIDVECNDETMPELARRGITSADCKPAQWDNFNRFGFFRTERMGYDRRVGAAHDENRQFFANIHKVWEQVYEWELENGEIKRDADGRPMIKKDDAGNPVVIPFADRDVRPVIYYTNTNYPADLADITEKMSADWDAAFSEAVASAKGISVDELRAEMEEKTGKPSVFRIEPNTCRPDGIEEYLARHPELRDEAEQAARWDEKAEWEPGDLERVCSTLTWHSRELDIERFVWQQMGDPRFSFVWWVHEDSPAGPLGYGPSSADPTNGRIISGNAHVYGAALDSYARSAADIVAAMNGDIEIEGIINGDSYDRWLSQPTTVAQEEMELTPEFHAELSRRLGSLNLTGLTGVNTADGQFDKAAAQRHMHHRILEPQRLDPVGRSLASNGREEAVRRILKDNPHLAARWVPEPVKQLVYRYGSLLEMDGEEMDQLAVDFTLNPRVITERVRATQERFAKQNVFLAEFLDDSVYGLALELRGMPYEEVYKRLRDEIYRGVMLHEVGHTVGLRHNFKASFDSLNYHNEFWDIRERYSDPTKRLEERLPEFRYASIMDYGARFNSDIKGLGKYDHAAIKFAYGKQLEAFDDGVTVPGRLDLEMELGDYRRLPEMLGGDYQNLWKRHDRPVDEVIAELQAGLAHNADVFARDPEASFDAYWVDRTVPYYFCSDEYRGTLYCEVWDEGSNNEEAVESAIQRYWNYFFFNAYRRGRNEFGFQNSYFGQMGRLAPYLTYPFQYLTFYDAYKDADGNPNPLAADLARAAVKGFNFVVQVMGTPEPGRYCRFNIDDGAGGYPMYLPQYYASSFESMRNCPSITLENGMGRDPYIEFNDDYDAKYEYFGTYYDKIILSFELFWDGTRFLRVTDESDQRRFNINYYRGFSPEMLELLNDMMFGGIFGPGSLRGYHYRVQEDEAGLGEPTIKFPRVIDPSQFGGDEQDPNLTQIWNWMPYDLMRTSLLRAVIFSSHTNDTRVDFMEYLTIDEEGSSEDRNYEEGTEVAVFTNPKSGATYTAAQTVDGKSLAFELLSNAQNYAEQRWQPAWDAYEADPTNPTRINDLETANETMEFYMGLVDEFRDIRTFVDYR